MIIIVFLNEYFAYFQRINVCTFNGFNKFILEPCATIISKAVSSKSRRRMRSNILVPKQYLLKRKFF